MHEWLLVLGIGLLGSAHCVGMCGGLVAVVHYGRGPAGARPALYLAGKTGAYAALGAVAGAAGALAGVALAGAQGVLSVALGLVLVGVGLAACGVLQPLGALPLGRRAASVLARPLGRLVASDRPAAMLGLGALNGLLPCGLVYAMLAQAAATGSAALGAATLAVFGVGTMPALWLVGTLGARMPATRRAWMQRAGGGLVVALGVLTLARAAMAWDAGLGLAAPGAAPADLLCLPPR